MKTYYAEVTVTYSFEFGEEDYEGTWDTPEAFAQGEFDSQGQGFEFEKIKVQEV